MAKFKETKKKDALDKLKIGDSKIRESEKQVSDLTKISDIIGKLEVSDDTDLKVIETAKATYKREGDAAHKEIEQQIDTVGTEVKSLNQEIGEERKRVERAKSSADSMKRISDIGASAAELASAEFGKSIAEYSKMESENTAKVEALKEQEKAHKNTINGLF